MGNPRKSIEQHKRQGTYQPVRHANLGVEVNAAALSVPKHLDREAKKTWKELYKAIQNAGLTVSEADAPALEAAATALTRARAASLVLETEGRYMGTADNRKRHPACIEQTETWKAYKEWALQLGLTPSARAGMPARPKEDAPADPFGDALSKILRAGESE